MYYDETAYLQTKEHLEKKVMKLRANLTQMDEEKKKEFKAPLYRLKGEIVTLWNELNKLSQRRITMKSDKDMEEAVRMWDAEYKKPIYNALFTDYSVDQALTLMEEYKTEVFIKYNGWCTFLLTKEEAESCA